MTVYTANPGDNLKTKAAALLAGDTLILNDGTYTASPGLFVAGIHGDASHWITIKAANDGQAIIDGGGTFAPLFLTNSSYVTLQGLHTQNSSSNAVYLFSGTGSNGPLNHITLQRITANGAANGNWHGFDISQDGALAPPSALTNILIEDCAAWGPGRYMFSAYHADTVTFRRCYGYWNTITNTLQQPRAAFNVYGSKNVTLENCIGRHAIPYQTETFNNYFAACWQTSDDPTNYPTDNTKVLGCVFYNNWDGWWVSDTSGSNLLFQDSYFESPSNAATWTTTPKGDAIEFDDPYVGSATIKNCVFRNSVRGFSKRNAANASTLTIQSNAFVGNTTGMFNDPGHSYCGFYGNTANGTTLAGTDSTSDPGYDTATYGRGGALYVKDTSAWKGQGAAGSDIGANILYQYVDGSLTPAKLWPWPMEERIVAELGVSPTYESGGGLWKTLSDVYPPAPAFAPRSFGSAYPSVGIEFPLLYAPRAFGGDYVTSTLYYLPRSFGSAVLYAWDVSEDITTRLRFGPVTPTTQDTSTRLCLSESLEYAPRSFGGDYPTNALFYQPRSFGASVLSGWGNLFDASVRLKVLAVQKSDLAGRALLLAVAVAGLAARLILLGVPLRNLAARLRTSVGSPQDQVARLRLRVAGVVGDVGLRLAFFSLARGDVLSRLRLRTATASMAAARLRLLAVGRGDTVSRLVFSFPRSLRDATLRLVLFAAAQRDNAIRLYLLAVAKRDQASRLIFSPTPILGFVARFLFVVQRSRDYNVLLVLRAADIDFWTQAARLRLLVVWRRDATLRLRFLPTQIASLAARLRLRAQAQADATLRLFLFGTRARDQAARLRLLPSFVVVEDLRQRLRILAVHTSDSATRFVFSLPRLRDYTARLVVRAASVDFWPLAARLKVLAVTRRDQASRVLLLLLHSTHQAGRLRLAARVQQDAMTRVLLLSSRLKDGTVRLRLLPSFVVTASIASRLRLLSVQAMSISSRFGVSVQRLQDYAARLVLHVSSTNLLDIRTRLRLLARSMQDQTYRLRVAATNLQGQATRLLLRAFSLRDAQGHLRLLDMRSWDTTLRMRLLPSFVVLSNASFRLRLLSVGTKDSAMRLVYGVGRVRDYAARLVLHAASTDLLDARQRVRVLAVSKRTLSARLYLFLNTTTSTRLILLDRGVRTLGLRTLLSTIQGKDVRTRLRLLGAPVSLLAGRLRLSCLHLLDTGTRLRLLVSSFLRVEDTATRTRLRAVHALSMGSRLAYGIPRMQDSAARMLLRAASVDVFPQASRVRLLGIALWDSSTRLRLVLVRQASMRLRLLAQSSHDGFTRLRTLAVAKRDQATRLRSFALHVADASLRLRLLSRPIGDTGSRLRFGSVTSHAQDAQARLLLTPLALITAVSSRDGQEQCVSRENANALRMRDGSTVLVARPPTL